METRKVVSKPADKDEYSSMLLVDEPSEADQLVERANGEIQCDVVRSQISISSLQHDFG
jgi:hypothetical protein